MDRTSAGYDDDFFAWTQSQAAELRRAGAERNNAPIDWENVAEEIEDMGNSQRHELSSRLKVLLAHLLKWQFCPELHERCMRQWRLTIEEQRDQIVARLSTSPSLRTHVQSIFLVAYGKARRQAADEADATPDRFPSHPPFALDQALDPAYPSDLFPPEWRG